VLAAGEVDRAVGPPALNGIKRAKVEVNRAPRVHLERLLRKDVDPDVWTECHTTLLHRGESHNG
jgi:hypothetical protein